MRSGFLNTDSNGRFEPQLALPFAVRREREDLSASDLPLRVTLVIETIIKCPIPDKSASVVRVSGAG